MKNYYEIIGVEVNASYDEIKKAYLRKMKEYHPDVYEGDKDFALEKTAEITEAYNVLKDEEQRRVYDLTNNFIENSNEEAIKNNETEDANILKDFGKKVGSFFKGLKSDLKNFASRKKQTNNKDLKKEKEQKEFLSEEEKQIYLNKKEKIKNKIIIWSLLLIVAVLIIISIRLF